MNDPVIVGSGKRIFPADDALRPLRLADSQVTTTGAILATYAREMADTAERDDGEELVAVIGGVTQVVIEIEDQDRAKQFWTQTLGFELAQDAHYGQERWLEVRTPDRAVTLCSIFARVRGRRRPIRRCRPPT